MPGNRDSATTKRKGLSLLFPRAGNAVDPEKLVFQWTPVVTERRDTPVFYRLVVYPYKPGIPVSRAVRGEPAYIADKLKTPYHEVAGSSGVFKTKAAYVWKIEARDKENRVIGTSGVQGFRFTPSPSGTLAPGMRVLHPPVAGTSGLRPSRVLEPTAVRGSEGFDLSSYLPPPPHVFGCPVRLRPLSHLTETEPPSATPPPEEPGELGPLGLIWGTEAGRLYLVPSLCRHAVVTWDYRHVSGCEQVLLQIADENGFQVPNAEDARADPGVRTWYTGPAFIDSHPCAEYIDALDTSLLRFMEEDEMIPPNNLDIFSHFVQFRSDHYWDIPSFAYLRLVPLDSEGNQIGPASDHVSVVRSEYPSIELFQDSVEYFWGENPFRRVSFTIRLGGEFPSGFFPTCQDITVPITFIFWTGTEASGHIGSIPEIIDNSFIEANGTPLSLTGTWYGKRAYFWTLDHWDCGSHHSFYLEQTSSSPVQLTDVNFAMYCIPGLSPHWRICRGRLLDDEHPTIGSKANEEFCESPNLTIEVVNPVRYGDGLAPIYDLFTRTLTGRRVSSVDGEQEVAVSFGFTEPMATSEDFRSFLLHHEGGGSGRITMQETRGGTIHTYDFRLRGFRVGLLDSSTQGYYAGRIVFDPPRLEMHFDGVDYFLAVE